MSMIVWRGVSVLDGVTPLVVLATFGSANVKTGGMVQTWILRDDVAPHDALKAGLDGAICGDCPHRSPASGGSGACYVTVWQGPRSTWAGYKRGNARPFDIDAFRGRRVRFGAYGDPAAVPFEVWEQLASVADGVTGYTHAWRSCDERFARIAMASCDSDDDYRAARRRGYRGFVVRTKGSAKPKGLVVCPASAEAGKRTVCADCMQCGGTDSGRRASITIEAHGASARAFKPLALSVIN